MRNAERRPQPLPAAGFTLIELLLAIVLLLVGIVSVAQLVPAAIESNFRNRYDSTSIIIAQRQLEQMMEQELTVGNPVAPGGVPAPNGFYWFPYTDPNGRAWRVLLGRAPRFFNAPPLTPPPPPPAPPNDGARLVPGTLIIDWTQGQDQVPPGYWNQFMTADSYVYETRWNVLTVYGNVDGSIRPVAKRFVIASRGSYSGRGALVPTTLVTWVGGR